MLEALPSQPQSDKKESIFVPFSPENEALKRKFQEFYHLLDSKIKIKVYLAITEFTNKMKEKYGFKDAYKYEALQIIGFSGQRADIDGQKMIANDFPGEDSVKHFVDTLIENYGPELREKV